jgi:saccharopine dehydrogenase-like NADP-dependent oxidoreductase
MHHYDRTVGHNDGNIGGKMKILALGGCGGMGMYAVKTLVNYRGYNRILLADIDEKRAVSFAKQFGNSVEPLSLDISDNNALESAVQQSDLVINTVGPFFRFGKLVLSSCINNGCNYIDICDDWEPTLELLKLNEQARASKITAIIGMGATPGISNMLAKKALLQLDTVEQVFTGWNLDSAKPEKIQSKPSAATIHGIHQLTGSIKTFENGKYLDVKPLSRIDLDYPGIGIRRAYTIGHPESVTFPRYYPSLKTSKNVFTTSRINLLGIKFFAWLVNNNFISVGTAARITEKIEGPADPKNTPEKMLTQFSEKQNLPPLFAIATGLKHGKPARVACSILSAPSGGMGGATGVPLAVVAMMIMRREISDSGVFSPESIINPDTFFNELAPLCSPQKKNSDDLVMNSCSWQGDI